MGISYVRLAAAGVVKLLYLVLGFGHLCWFFLLNHLGITCEETCSVTDLY